MTGLNSKLGVVLRKELADAIRDRRSILSAVLPMLLIPALLFFALASVADRVESAGDISVPVVGAEHGRPLVAWLDSQAGIDIEEGPADALAAVREGSVGFALVIPEDFGERFGRSKTAEVQIVVDGSDDRADRAAGRVRGLLRAYAQMIGNQRLVVRGVSPEVIRAVDIETLDIQTGRERAARAMEFLPFVLLMAAFAGGLPIAIDSTAGERERGSLERLLLNPVPQHWIVMGKWLAGVMFSWASVGLALAGLWAVIEHSPLRRIGLSVDIGPVEIAGLFALAVSLAPALVGLEMAISTLARSYKEAQTYVSFLMLLPMVPMILTMQEPVESELWNMFVPMLGQYVLMNDLIKGHGLAPVDFAIAAATAVAVAVALLFATARLFRSERIVFGRSS